MVLIVIADGLTNVLARLGFGKAAQGQYTADDHSAEYGALYNTSWVAERAIDAPVDDACRKWRKWSGDADLAKAIQDEEERIKLIEKVKIAAKSARLHGEAVIFIGTNVKTLKTHLQPTERIEFLEVFKHGEYSVAENTTNRLRNSSDPTYYLIEGEEVHASRLIILGDGKSKIQAAFDAIKNADSVAGNVAELVYEAKLDVYSVPDLLAQDDDLLFKRLALANQGKSIVNGILLDKEETYEQKQINFSGLKELLFASYQIVAGATGIPASKLLGMSVSGLNATGDNEVADYDDLVMTVQTDLTNALLGLDDLIAHSVGAPNADYEWQPLRSATPKQQSEIYQANATALSTLANLEIYTDDQLLSIGEKLLGDLVTEGLDNVY